MKFLLFLYLGTTDDLYSLPIPVIEIDHCLYYPSCMDSSIIFKQCWFCNHWIQTQQIICNSCATHLNIFHNPSLPFKHIHELNLNMHHAWIYYLKFNPKAKPLIITICKLLNINTNSIAYNQQHSLSNEQLFIHSCVDPCQHHYSGISLFSYDKKKYCQNHICYAFVNSH